MVAFGKVHWGSLGSALHGGGLVWVVLAMMAVCSGLVTACSIVGALDGGGDCLGMNVGLCQGVGSGFLNVSWGMSD